MPLRQWGTSFMDPNANLLEQRRIAARLLRGADSHTMDDAARLAELVAAMDEWLVAGGVLPEAWSRDGHDEEG